MGIKRIFFSLFGIVTLSSCSSEITISKINQPSERVFRKDIKQVANWNKQFIEADPLIVKKAVDEETYYFNRKIKIRNKVIDSLNLLKKEKLLIIDSNTDSNGHRMESSYFMYDDKIILAEFLEKDSISNGHKFIKMVPQIKQVTRQYLAKDFYDVNYIYESMIGRKIPSVLNGGSGRTSYLVTLVHDRKVAYYSVSGSEKYKVVKLY